MATKLYVGNLPFSFTSQELRQVFEPFGVVRGAEIVMDRMTGRSRGFGFVEMETADGAAAAIQGAHDSEVGGRKLVVNEARERAPGGPRPGGGGGFGGPRPGGGGGGFRGGAGGFRGGAGEGGGPRFGGGGGFHGGGGFRSGGGRGERGGGERERGDRHGADRASSRGRERWDGDDDE